MVESLRRVRGDEWYVQLHKDGQVFSIHYQFYTWNFYYQAFLQLVSFNGNLVSNSLEMQQWAGIVSISFVLSFHIWFTFSDVCFNILPSMYHFCLNLGFSRLFATIFRTALTLCSSSLSIPSVRSISSYSCACPKHSLITSFCRRSISVACPFPSSE